MDAKLFKDAASLSTIEDRLRIPLAGYHGVIDHDDDVVIGFGRFCFGLQRRFDIHRRTVHQYAYRGHFLQASRLVALDLLRMVGGGRRGFRRSLQGATPAEDDSQ